MLMRFGPLDAGRIQETKEIVAGQYRVYHAVFTDHFKKANIWDPTTAL